MPWLAGAEPVQNAAELDVLTECHLIAMRVVVCFQCGNDIDDISHHSPSPSSRARSASHSDALWMIVPPSSPWRSPMRMTAMMRVPVSAWMRHHSSITSAIGMRGVGVLVGSAITHLPEFLPLSVKTQVPAVPVVAPPPYWHACAHAHWRMGDRASGRSHSGTWR